MGGMAGVGVAPPPNHPPTSVAGGSTRARHPGPSIERARGVAGNAILGAFRCRSPPSHPTCTPDNPLRIAPFLIARYDDARAKPTHARALRRRRRSLARSRARCVAVAVEAAGGYVARHARYARRASRACTRTSSPRIARVITVFRPPRARPARARCCSGGARSLARARGGGGGGVGGGVQLHRATRASRASCASCARVRVITAHRARHHRPPSPMSPMRTRGSGGGAVSFARLLARAEAEADGHSHVVRVSRVTRARARHPCHGTC